MFNNFSKNQLSLILGGSIVVSGTAGNIGSITQIQLGIGSSTVLNTDTKLLTGSITGGVTSVNYTSQNVSLQFDFSSVTMSGLNLKEFGIQTSGGGLTGSLYSRDVIPSLQFDGTNELEIVFNAQVF